MKHGALTTLRYSTLWPQHSLWSSSSKSCLLVRSGVASRHLTFIFRGHKPINKIKNTVRQRSPSSEHQIREFLSEEWCSSPESIFRVLDRSYNCIYFLYKFRFFSPTYISCDVPNSTHNTFWKIPGKQWAIGNRWNSQSPKYKLCVFFSSSLN